MKFGRRRRSSLNFGRTRKKFDVDKFKETMTWAIQIVAVVFITSGKNSLLIPAIFKAFSSKQFSFKLKKPRLAPSLEWVTGFVLVISEAI